MFGNNPTLRFPGNLAQVSSLLELRGISPYEMNDESAVLVSAAGLFTFDASSTANDDGVSVIRPNGFTPLQAGRWVQPSPVPQTDANTFATLAALQASGLDVAYLVGDPNEADGLFIKVGGTLVRQDSAGVAYKPSFTGAQATDVGDELGSFGVRPEAFGATGTMLTDDTLALQAALNTGFNVRLTTGKSYGVSSKLVWDANNVSLTGGGTIKVLPWNFANDPGGGAGNHLRVLFVNGENTIINGINWDATGVTPGTGIENGFIWATGPRLTVTSCNFTGMPKGTSVWGLNAYVNFSLNTVVNCTGAVFVRGRNNIIASNIIINATDAAIALNGATCKGTIVNGNTITNETGAIIPAMIAAEESASHWVITNNELIGVNGGGISAINVLDSSSVEGGIIANNEIDARLWDNSTPTTTNPAALVSVTGSYRGIKMHSNKIYCAPNGPANSRLVVLPATETEFYDNVVDATGATGLSAIIDILAGNGGMIIRNNKVVGFPGTRLFFINAGNYGNAPIRFVGGRFLNGAEGINGELAIGSIVGLKIYIQNIAEVSAGMSFINAPTTVGYRGDALNAGAWKRPHRIAEMTDMFVPSIPTGDGGTMGVAPGDSVQLMDPGYPNSSKGYVYTANGAIWRPWGTI